MDYIDSNNDNKYCVKLKGKFSFSDHSDFKVVLENISKNKPASVELDFSEVTFVDSAALGLLLVLRDETEKVQAKAVLVKPQGQVKKMFDISRFDELFTIIE